MGNDVSENAKYAAHAIRLKDGNTTDMLRAAYAIDFATLRQENERLTQDLAERTAQMDTIAGIKAANCCKQEKATLRTELQQAREEREKYRLAAIVMCGAHIGVPQNKCPVCELEQQKADYKELARIGLHDILRADDLQQQLAQSQADHEEKLIIEQSVNESLMNEIRQVLSTAREEYDPKHTTGCDCSGCRRFRKAFTLNYTDPFKRERDALQSRLDEAVEELAKAQPVFCSMKCPNVKYGPEPWTHVEECAKMTAFLAAQRKAAKPTADQSSFPDLKKIHQDLSR